MSLTLRCETPHCFHAKACYRRVLRASWWPSGGETDDSVFVRSHAEMERTDGKRRFEGSRQEGEGLRLKCKWAFTKRLQANGRTEQWRTHMSSTAKKEGILLGQIFDI